MILERVGKFASVICILLLGFSTIAQASENRIVLLPIINSSGDARLDALGDGFSDLLLSMLDGYEDVTIIDRDNMHRVIGELSLSLTAIQNSDIIRLGNLLQANRFIRGGFVNVNGVFKVNAHIFDVQTTKLLFSVEQSGNLEEIHIVAEKLAQQIAVRIVNGQGITNSGPIDEAPEVNLHFMKGLGYYYSNLFDHAVAEFMQVMDLDPTRADARFWLGKSYYEGGENAHAMIEFQRFLDEFPDDKNIKHAKKYLQKTD